jgi:hypothetical protein
MTAQNSVIQCGSVSGQQVRGLTSAVKITIPHSYTRDFIPLDRSQIPTKNTDKKLSHLQELADELPPLQNCDVGLLIGCNCPQALAPRETIVGKGSEPYALRTDLGWSMVGYGSPCFDREVTTGYSYRVSVKELPILSPREFQHASAFVQRDFYVDDGLSSVELESEAVHPIKDLKRCVHEEAYAYTSSYPTANRS